MTSDRIDPVNPPPAGLAAFEAVNPPVHRASTVIFRTMADLDAAARALAAGEPGATTYGTHGTPTTAALEELLLAGEGGAGVVLSSSGLAAIAVALFALVRTGDHVLVTDSAYHPARVITTELLGPLGVEIEFYDPLVGPGIAELIRPTTRAIWLESPGSNTFEVQDLPAIVAAARAADHPVATILDNTYGSPGLLAPFQLGVDISVVALTKYWAGHADVLAGATFANEQYLPAIRRSGRVLGQCLNGDEAYLTIRGARTVRLRLAAHEAAGLEMAHRLDGHPRVGRVLHPALPSSPGHDLFRRDFRGSNGLFSIELLDAAGGPATAAEAAAFVDRLAARGRFGIGYSWGGFESLAIPARPVRSVHPWTGGALVRLHVGLEPVDALWADLETALGG